VAISSLPKQQKSAHKFLKHQNEQGPKFSQDWLTNLKKRHNIKRRVQHGEAHGAYTKKIEEEIRAVQTLCVCTKRIETLLSSFAYQAGMMRRQTSRRLCRVT